MSSHRNIRYGVAGLGWFAQAAILPAFAHARRNSTLAALVSDDPVKLRELGARYDVAARYDYDDLENAIRREELDALYVAVPNHRHRELTERAASAGAHVLCEKAMAVDEDECRAMIRATAAADVELMIAYRLHFEKANLEALEIVRGGQLGEPRLFEAVFSNKVEDPDNTRLVAAERGGGPLYDVGIYCINAARHVFGDEPQEVMALAARGEDERFAACDEAVAAVLRFPGDRLAVVAASFAAADRDSYTVHGTKGHLRVEPAFSTTGALRHHLQVGDQSKKRSFAGRDQVAPEILYFSDCILEGREPEPDGVEGLADVRVITAILRSAKERRAVAIPRTNVGEGPDLDQEARRPPVEKQELVHAESPAG
jgi:glucose-fructose oxidoreductase